MKLKNKDSKFNMWNTNGRRKDITDAYTIYLSILNTEFESGNYEWDSFPKSIGQYVFYKEAVGASPEIFKDLNKLESFEEILSDLEYAEAFHELDKEGFLQLEKGRKLLDDLDKNLEFRARNYTSNLLKIGFTYYNRKISPAGLAYLNEKVSNLDKFEELLPINSINLILLRQLSKLRIYSSDGLKYYSPFNLLMYILLKKDRISDTILFKMIELLTPYFPVDIDKFIEEVLSSTFEEEQLAYNSRMSGEENIFPHIKGTIEYEEFQKYFTSQKSSNQTRIYYEFYCKNRQFVQNRTQSNLDLLIELLRDKNKGPVIKTAFGGKSSVYDTRQKQLSKFIDLNEDNIYLNSGDNNAV